MILKDFFKSDNEFYKFILSISKQQGVMVEDKRLVIFKHNLRIVHFPDSITKILPIGTPGKLLGKSHEI